MLYSFGTPEVVWLDSEGEEEVRQMQTKTLILSPVKGVKGPFPTITFCYRNQGKLSSFRHVSHRLTPMSHKSSSSI